MYTLSKTFLKSNHHWCGEGVGGAGEVLCAYLPSISSFPCLCCRTLDPAFVAVTFLVCVRCQPCHLHLYHHHLASVNGTRMTPFAFTSHIIVINFMLAGIAMYSCRVQIRSRWYPGPRKKNICTTPHLSEFPQR